jgi:hypothetical protein
VTGAQVAGAQRGAGTVATAGDLSAGLAAQSGGFDASVGDAEPPIDAAKGDDRVGRFGEESLGSDAAEEAVNIAVAGNAQKAVEYLEENAAVVAVFAVLGVAAAAAAVDRQYSSDAAVVG